MHNSESHAAARIAIKWKYCVNRKERSVLRNSVGCRCIKTPHCEHEYFQPLGTGNILHELISNVFTYLYSAYEYDNYNGDVVDLIDEIASCYSVLVSKYFVEQFIYYFRLLQDNMMYFEKNCSCFDIDKCKQIVERFLK